MVSAYVRAQAVFITVLFVLALPLWSSAERSAATARARASVRRSASGFSGKDRWAGLRPPFLFSRVAESPLGKHPFRSRLVATMDSFSCLGSEQEQ